MTWPLGLRMGGHVPSDLGDPLYNIWVMSWNRHALLDGAGPVADANIFYPHPKTLYFADPIFGLSALGAVLRVVSPNEVFTYNLLFFLSFVFSAAGIYALVFHLTGRKAAAVVSGIIFAFCPYRFAHYSHLELLYGGWIPLGFLFLHRFLARKRWADLVGFTMAYIFQAIFCGYYAVFFTLFGGIFLGAGVIRGRLWKDTSFWPKAGVFVGLSLSLLGPIFIPFIDVHQKYFFNGGQDYQTWIHYSADLQDYLAVPPFNRFWGGLMGTNKGAEWCLFPGAIAVGLAAVGLFFRDRAKGSAVNRERRIFRKMRSKRGRRSLPPRVSHDTKGEAARLPATNLYLALSVVAFFLSLGPIVQMGGKPIVKSPLSFLDSVLGSFRGIRSLSRFGIIVMLGIAVLAGFGMTAIFGRIRAHGRNMFGAAGLGLLCLVEYASLPLPLAKVPVGKEIPPIYESVRKLDKDSVLIELPMPQVLREKPVEALRMYYSTTHWKKLVNGYSGYFSPDYEVLREAMELFPSEDTFDILRDLGVDHVLVHTLGYRAKKGRMTVERMQALPDRLEVVDASRGSYLFRVHHVPPKSRPQPVLQRISDKRAWKARAGRNSKAAMFAIDENLATFWSTNSPQNPGHYFVLDLGAVQPLQRVDLWLYPWPRHYPRGFVLSGSTDGRHWNELRNVPLNTLRFPTQGIDDYRSYKAEITFPSAGVRYLRFVLSRQHHRPWSISEIECWISSGKRPSGRPSDS